ncbi:MAG: hypothetical protein AB7S26_38655 [Sandaracinaceae bacterium]
MPFSRLPILSLRVATLGASLVTAALGCDAPAPMDAGGSDAGAEPDAGIDAGAPLPCDGAPGTYHEQSFLHDGEERYYFLYVPSTYRCEDAHAMWVDFHGSYGVVPGARPEEAYTHEDVVALAEELGMILVRPRSRPVNNFFWDGGGPADLADNQAFARELVADLMGRYHVDPDRIYASGYSSGSNMAASFLVDPASPFSGLAVFAGALWAPAPLRGRAYDDPPRVYLATGFRDLHRTYTDAMIAAMDTFPAERLFSRETDAGHVLDAWNYREAYHFFEGEGRPDPGVLASGWDDDLSAADGATILEAEVDPTGTLFISDARGRVCRRDADAWTTVYAAAPERPFASLAIGDTSGYVAALDSVFVRDGDSFTQATLPTAALGFAYHYAASGDATEGWIAGTTAYVTTDGGHTFTEIETQAYYSVQAIERAAGGTALAVGAYSFLGRRPAGGAFTPIAPPMADLWLNAAASLPGSASFAVAGAAGAIFVSADDALTFHAATSGTSEDLYAVDFADASVGAVGGAHGTVLVTQDGGETWTDASTGLDAMIADVAWLDATTLIAVGEGGAVLRLHVD